MNLSSHSVQSVRPLSAFSVSSADLLFTTAFPTRFPDSYLTQSVQYCSDAARAAA
jgi:hypothetical protein